MIKHLPALCLTHHSSPNLNNNELFLYSVCSTNMDENSLNSMTFNTPPWLHDSYVMLFRHDSALAFGSFINIINKYYKLNINMTTTFWHTRDMSFPLKDSQSFPRVVFEWDSRSLELLFWEETRHHQQSVTKAFFFTIGFIEVADTKATPTLLRVTDTKATQALKLYTPTTD